MKILQITNKADVIHIQFEAGQQGKKNMMLKINRFLTSDLKAQKARLQRAADNIYDMPEVNDRWNDLSVKIENINHCLSKITNIVRIEDYNLLHGVEVASYEVY